MCVICAVKSKRHPVSVRIEISAHLLKLVEFLFSRPDPEGHRQYIVTALRKTADQIEQHSASEAEITALLTAAADGAADKAFKIEKMLLAQEGEFYQRYGIPMPEELRSNLRIQAWDAMEDEPGVGAPKQQEGMGHVGTERTAGGPTQGDGRERPPADHHASTTAEPHREGGAVRHAEQERG